MRWTHPAWTLLALALATASAARADDTGADPYADVDNPHGSADGCLACHAEPDGADEVEEGADPMPVGDPLPVVETCRSCHPTADMHPVGMTPVDVTPKEGWPLENGKVVCSTCHVEKAHDPEALGALPVPWHRDGPYETITEFCYQCHEPMLYVRSSPHDMASPYAEGDPNCAACHTVPAERGAAPEQATLRTKATQVCQTCHKGVPHYGADVHLGSTLPEDWDATLPEQMALTADGAIQCWTCHDVHAGSGAGKVGHTRLSEQIGALARDTWREVPEGAIWPGTEHGGSPMLALPLADSELCSACHGAGPGAGGEP